MATCGRLRRASVLSVCGCGTRVLRKGVLLRDTYVPHRRLPLDHSREKPHVSRDPVSLTPRLPPGPAYAAHIPRAVVPPGPCCLRKGVLLERTYIHSRRSLDCYIQINSVRTHLVGVAPYEQNPQFESAGDRSFRSVLWRRMAFSSPRSRSSFERPSHKHSCHPPYSRTAVQCLS